MDPRSILEDLRSRGAQYADLRAQTSQRTSLEWKDGETRKAVAGSEAGFGIRVLVDGAWGVASCNRADRLATTAGRAFSLARAVGAEAGGVFDLAPAKPATGKAVRRADVDPREVSMEAKAEIARAAGIAARGADVVSVRAAYEDSVVATRFVSTDGADLESESPRTMLQLELAAARDGRRISYRERIGGTVGFELFRRSDPEALARKAAEAAARVLMAEPAPSGILPVITDPDLTGVFAHEAIGHACEADLVLAGESILAGRIGERIGSELVTIVDDATVPGAFGSFAFDDEGVAAQRKVLLDRGRLAGYIHSRETAGRLSMDANGGARAESYAAEPLVRMSNTLVEAGDWGFDEMVEDVKRGVYAKGTRGGQVDVAKGSFQFSAQEAFLIEDGEITRPLRDVSLSGDILRTIREIDAVGKDARLASPGICGKGQWVPVGDGGPHLRIRRCRVGGG